MSEKDTHNSENKECASERMFADCTCTPTQVEGVTKKKGDCPSCMAGFSREDFAGNCTCDYFDRPTQVPDGGDDLPKGFEIAHETEFGYCCACGYDIAGFEERITAAVRQRDDAWVQGLHSVGTDFPVKGNGFKKNMALMDKILKAVHPPLQ